MIRLDNISKHHGHQLLFIEASMVLQKGEKVGLAGSNGAGKSTIFRMIAGQFSQVQMQDAAAGLLTVLAGAPGRWGSVSQDLVGEFTGVRGVAWRDLYYYQTQLVLPDPTRARTAQSDG